MATTEPIRASCSDCGAGRDCDDCLVGFVLRGENAAVVEFAAVQARRAPRLDADLAAVFALLRQSEMEPVLVSLSSAASFDGGRSGRGPVLGERVLRDAI